MLTRRENFLKTLRRQPHDWMPSYYALDPFNYPNDLPTEIATAVSTYSPVETMVEAMKYMGLDVLVRLSPGIVTGKNGPRGEQMEGGKSKTIWTTPYGEMDALAVPSAEAGTAFTIVHPVKEMADYDKLMWLMETEEYTLVEANIPEVQRWIDVVGDSGICYANGPSTPIMELTRSWTGLQEFVFHLMEDQERVERALDAMAEVNCRHMEMLAANTPCEVIVFWDDCNSLYLSKNMFAQYSLPVLQRYADICHKHGKILVNHTCGRINAFLDLYAQTRNDSIDWLTPPTTGDVLPAEAMKHFDGKITPMIAPQPSVFRNESPQSVAAHIRELLADVDPLKVIAMLPLPIGSPIENAKMATRVLTEEFGVPLNRSEKFGCVLD